MGELSMRRITSADQLWVCDDCGQEGVRANGKDILDTNDIVVMWFCYNCVEKIKRNAV